ncbi:MAG: hypothetical protein IE887_07635 [Campylobacterales bacterium]|nr:hypothetical protein [Campylobacterales bacterium]
MISPTEIFSELQRNGKVVIVGQLRLLPPSRGLMDDDIIYEFLVPQTFTITDSKGNVRKLISGELNGHAARNRYFLKSFEEGASWKYLGESDKISDMFPLKMQPPIKPGEYLLRGIITQDLDDEHVLMAEDTKYIEIVS